MSEKELMKKCQTAFKDNFEVIQCRYIIFATISIKNPKKTCEEYSQTGPITYRNSALLGLYIPSEAP